MYRILIELAGHEALLAENGALGLELFKSTHPDIALVDIGLPGMDGYEIARRFRAEPNGAGVLLVALTGYGSATDRDRSRQAGFDLHLLKPVDPETLQSVLDGMAMRLGASSAPAWRASTPFASLLSLSCRRSRGRRSLAARPVAWRQPPACHAVWSRCRRGLDRRRTPRASSPPSLDIWRATTSSSRRAAPSGSRNLVVRRGAGLRSDVRDSSSGWGMPRTRHDTRPMDRASC